MAADDEDRWADAESIVDGVPTQAARRRMRRFRRLMVGLIVGVAVVGGVVGGIAGAAGGDPSEESTSDAPWSWTDTAGLVLGTAGLAVLAALLVVQLRSGRLRFAWNNPALVLTRQQRKQLSDEIRGRRPADPRHVRVARDLAAHAGGDAEFVGLAAGLLMILVGQAFLSPGRWVFTGVLAVTYVALLPLAFRSARQARRFIAEHPEPQSAGG